jgi:glycerol-3-phosphate dehydrogenase (NAD(P)+)
MNSIGKICILGGGTWATALAKMVLMNQQHINWYIRRDDQIEGFYRLGRNPNYLTNVKFNLAQITFYSNIEKAIKDSDTVIIAIPSPYVKQSFRRVWNSTFRGKFIVSALKGIIPNDNMVMSEYLADNFKIPFENIGVLSGPCHAEEVALERGKGKAAGRGHLIENIENEHLNRCGRDRTRGGVEKHLRRCGGYLPRINVR